MPFGVEPLDYLKIKRFETLFSTEPLDYYKIKRFKVLFDTEPLDYRKIKRFKTLFSLEPLFNDYFSIKNSDTPFRPTCVPTTAPICIT